MYVKIRRRATLSCCDASFILGLTCLTDECFGCAGRGGTLVSRPYIGSQQTDLPSGSSIASSDISTREQHPHPFLELDFSAETAISSSSDHTPMTEDLNPKRRH